MTIFGFGGNKRGGWSPSFFSPGLVNMTERLAKPMWYSPNKTWQEHYWIYTDKGTKEECWRWQGYIRKDGYSQMEIVDSSGYRHLKSAHQASYLIHTGSNLDKGLVLRHTCDNRWCVNPHHLLPGTQKENVQDMVERGRKPVGSKHVFAKLKEEDVREMRRRAEAGESYASIGRDFPVSRGMVGRICKGERWKHVGT